MRIDSHRKQLVIQHRTHTLIHHRILTGNYHAVYVGSCQLYPEKQRVIDTKVTMVQKAVRIHPSQST